MADRDRLSAIAHRGHPIAGPLSDEHVDDLIGRLVLPPGARVLDVGCGPGEWIVRILERFPDAIADAVDPSPWAISAARERADARGLGARLSLHAATIEAFGPETEAYDLAMCLGSTHAYDGLEQTLDALGETLRPGGRALVGDLFWSMRPTRVAMDALSASADAFPRGVDGLRRRFVDARFDVGWVSESSLDEWDAYESAWLTLGGYADEHPHDADADEIRDTVRSHRAAYLAGYRGVLGYAVVLAMPSPPAAPSGVPVPTSRRSNVR